MFLSDFHHEQAWLRWFSKSSNRCTDIKEKVIAHLRSIAYSMKETETTTRIVEIKSADWWNEEGRSNLRKYVTKTWLKIKKVKL